MIYISQIWLLQPDNSTIPISKDYRLTSKRRLNKFRKTLKEKYECKNVYFKYTEKKKCNN